MALHSRDANAKKLGNIQRTFSKTNSFGGSQAKLDYDSDQLGSDDWPASQAQHVKPARPKSESAKTAVSTAIFGIAPASKSAAQSSAHWRTKTNAAFMNGGTSSSKDLMNPSHKRAMSTSQAVDIMADLDPKYAGRRRPFPWDDIAQPKKKHKTGGDRASVGSGSTFYTVGSAVGAEAGPSRNAGSESAKANLATKSLNIKQKVVLSPEQQRILKLVVDEGKNIFFTGSAGTGKSVLLREIIASLKKKHRSRPDAVAVTASTGMAACNIGGTTIHSFGGIGIGAEPTDVLVNKIRKNRKAMSRWQRTLVLVVDEVSMVDGDLFDKLAGIAQQLRKKPHLPFGGIQLVVTGDFFQLPPVSKGTAAKFAFESASWRECITHTVNLTQVFRQKDTQFIDMLNEMRFGTLSEKSIAKFRELARKPKYPDDGIEPTELFPMRNEVERSNQSRLSSLPGEARTFLAEDSGDSESEERKRLLENFMAPYRLVLKPGSQVMLIKNKDESLVNGSTGIVAHFAPPGGHMDESSEADMPYNEGGHEFDFREPKVKQEGLPAEIKDLALKKANAGAAANRNQEEVPWIRWSLPDGRTSAPEPVAREEFKMEQGNIVKARRKQFPLMLAWAVSIHKSQGQTLARVKVDLGKVFEAGQTYVALSRATSIDALQVIGFQASKVGCYPQAEGGNWKAFY